MCIDLRIFLKFVRCRTSYFSKEARGDDDDEFDVSKLRLNRLVVPAPAVVVLPVVYFLQSDVDGDNVESVDVRLDDKVSRQRLCFVLLLLLDTIPSSWPRVNENERAPLDSW